MLALLGAVYLIVALVYYVSGLHVPVGIITPKTVGTVIIYSHLLFLTVFIIWLIRVLDDNDHGRYRASRVYERLVEKMPDGDSLSEQDHNRFADACSEQVGTFKLWFLGFWCAMLLLYVFFAAKSKYDEFYPSPGQDSAVAQRLNHRLQESIAGEFTPKEAEALTEAGFLKPGDARHVLFSPFLSLTSGEFYPPNGPDSAVVPDLKRRLQEVIPAKFSQEEKAELSEAGRPLKPEELWQPLIFPFFTFMANNVSLFFIFGCFVALYLPAGHETGKQRSGNLTITAEDLIVEARAHHQRQKNLCLGFGGLLLLFTLAFPAILYFKNLTLTTNNWNEYVAVFDALSGTLNAVVVALMIARLDSKLIGLPPWLISILYFYSGIQPLFVVFDQSVDVFGTVRTAVLIVVFIFKVYFFLIILYSLQNGRLLNYFYCSSLLNKQVVSMRISGKLISAEVFIVDRWRKLLESFCLRILEAIKVCGRLLLDGQPRLRPLRIKASMLLVSLKSYIHWALTHTPGFNGLLKVITRPIFRRRTERLLILCALLGWLGIIYFVASLLYYAGRLGSDDIGLIFSPQARYVMIFLNLVALLVIIFVLIKVPRNYGSADSDAVTLRTVFPRDLELAKKTKNPVKRFQRYFLMFWLVMFAFYVALAFQQYIEYVNDIKLPPPVIISTLEDALVVSKTSLRDSQTILTSALDAKRREPALPRSMVASSLLYPWFSFLLNNLMVLFVFLCFTVLYVSVGDRQVDAKHALLRNYSILVCVLLTMLFPLPLFFIEKSTLTQTSLTTVITVFAAIGGTLNAVALALLIARLDSRLIRLPTSVISVLYSYSALQPLFVVFAPEGNVFRAIETSALATALIFKVCLVVIIVYAWQSARFEDYLVYFPFLNSRVNSIFDNQFEIKTYGTHRGKFKYSIFKGNVEKYKTDETFDTRVECDTAVGDVRSLMKEKANYGDPQKVHGTYWVQVEKLNKANEREVICESTSLRSEAEAKELIEESIEMVPYCKYDRG